MTVSIVLVLLAVAVLLLPGAGAPQRLRFSGRSGAATADRRIPALPLLAAVASALAVAAVGGRAAAMLSPVAGVVMLLVCRRLIRSGRSPAAADPLALAGAWDLIAACLRAGLPVATAVRAGAGAVPESAAGVALRRCTELLALGGDPDQAWHPALSCPDTAAFGRAARRSAHSGSALADSLIGLAAELRADVGRRSEARAGRAGVLIAGPLGLCFLPAFLLIGVIPVVVGLADRVLAAW